MNRPPSLKMIEPRLPSRRSGAVCLAVRLASEDRHDPNYICTILKLGLKWAVRKRNLNSVLPYATTVPPVLHGHSLSHGF